MRPRSLIAITAALSAGALTLTACGSRDSGKSSVGESGTTTVVIGVDAPLTGANSATGLGIKYGAKIAIDEANAKKTVPGVTFKMVALDDKAQPATGQQNASQIVGNKAALAAIGPLNSGVATSMQQTFAAAHMAEVSPANTAPELTQGKNWQTSKKRPFSSYFRTSTTDANQGGYAAQYAVKTLGKKKLFVVDDKSAYGAGLAHVFKQDAVKFGGTIVGEDHVNVGDRDFSSLVTKINNSGADLLYYGGMYDESQVLTKQLKQAGADLPLFGGDGMYSDAYIKNAGKAAEGDLATSVGVPLDSVDSAQQFIKTYKDKKYPGDYGTYGGYTYDAANAIIKAVGKVISADGGKLPDDLDKNRADVVTAVQKISFQGIAGRVAFDKYGDTVNKQLTVYQVKNGKWTAVKSGVFQAG